MSWTKKQIGDHKKAVKLLAKIKDETFQYIKSHENISEYEVQEFVIRRFKRYSLKSDTWRPIVSFRKNTSTVHYYASIKSTKRLQLESLILVDIWARLNKKGAPFADITWIGYYGKKIPSDIEKGFHMVIEARDKALDYIKMSLRKKVMPTGKEIDDVARNYFAIFGFDKYFLHGTGHPLGIINDHGRGVYINQKNKRRISRMIGYTIEPGIYLKNKFGIRSEIDFYIDDNYKMIITSEMQEKIIKL